MYQYRLLGANKVGNKNLYSVAKLDSTENYLWPLSKFKPVLEKGEVVNAIWKNRVLKTHDVMQGLAMLDESLQGCRVLQAEVKRVVDGGKRRYICFYNAMGDDVTYYVWMVLSKYCSLTQKKELSVSGVGMDMIWWVLKALNSEARNCGYPPVVEERYNLYKRQ